MVKKRKKNNKKRPRGKGFKKNGCLNFKQPSHGVNYGKLLSKFVDGYLGAKFRYYLRSI